jgi:hypothetical protein
VGARGSLDTGGATAASPLANRAMADRGCYRGWVHRLSTALPGSAFVMAMTHVILGVAFLLVAHYRSIECLRDECLCGPCQLVVLTDRDHTKKKGKNLAFQENCFEGMTPN